MCADVVVVGGGPVGCWTALQIKKRNPSLQIEIYERYPEYQRDHMLSIRRSSLQRYSKRINDSLETEMYQQIANSNGMVSPYKEGDPLPKVTHIRTLAFEQILKEQCAKLGINITYKKVESPDKIMAAHPECSIFIAADGANSAMRSALLGEDSVVKKSLLHSIDVKYEAYGQPSFLRIPTLKEMDVIVVETIGREKDGKSTIGLRFLVDEDLYNTIPDANLKNPIRVESTGRLERKIRDFQNLRKDHAHEITVTNSEKVTKITLSQYASRQFAVKVDTEDRRVGWFLVGDAAMGLPFYRSINSGLMLGSQLGSLIGSQRLSLDRKADIYNNAVRPMKLTREFGTVAAKMHGLNFYKKAVRPVLRGLAVAGVLGVVVPVFLLASLVNPRIRMM